MAVNTQESQQVLEVQESNSSNQVDASQQVLEAQMLNSSNQVDASQQVLEAEYLNPTNQLDIAQAVIEVWIPFNKTHTAIGHYGLAGKRRY